MNRAPFTIDEDVVRRLILRRDLHEQNQQLQSRQNRFAFRFWRGLTGLTQSLPIAPRARWS